MPKNLNLIYDYRIYKGVKYSSVSVSKFKKYPVKDLNCWKRSVYSKPKEEVKKTYYKPQKRRCAYCRKKLNALGYFNHIDHVIPKSHHCRWMFKPKNLVITCEVCNPLKNSVDTLIVGHCEKKFPKTKNGFTIFNPHFHRWSDYFEIEDGMFIRGKRAEGDETIKVCKLYQENYVIQFAEESGINPTTSIKRAVLRTRNFPSTSLEYKAAKKVIDYYKDLI